MAARVDVTNTILEACKTLVPAAEWTVYLKGGSRGNGLYGSVSCDRTEFEQQAKGLTWAKADYKLDIVDMNGENDVDAMADILFEAFNGTDMGGLVYDVSVNRIIYGSVPTSASAEVVELELSVTYTVG